MNKLKVGIGIGLMVFFGILLAREVVLGIINEMGYYQCTHPPAGFMGAPYPCQNFQSHLKFIIIYLAPFGMGVLFLVSSLKNFSLSSLSRGT